MAYQENTAIATVAALIDQLVNFMAANGWTIERNNLVGSNRTTTVRIVGTTDYVHIYNDTATDIQMRISVGYNAAVTPALQPNVSARICWTDVQAGPYPKTWMFSNSDGTSIVMAIATATSGMYRHLAIGMLDKAGVFTGGTYVDGTYWPTGANSYPGNFNLSYNSCLFGASYLQRGGMCRVDIPADSRTDYIPDLYVSNPQLFTEYVDRLKDISEFADNNEFSGRSIFHPILYYVKRLVAYFSPLGVVKNVRSASLAKFTPEQEITIGPDVWKVFPAVRKAVNHNLTAGSAASGDYGFAFKKEV